MIHSPICLATITADIMTDENKSTETAPEKEKKPVQDNGKQGSEELSEEQLEKVSGGKKDILL